MTTETAELPEPIGAYQLTEVLGHGGSATTYRGRRSPVGGASIEVAFKLLEQGATFDPAEVQRQAAIMHPNVVRVLDVVQDGGRTGVVLELVDGIDLLELCERRSPLDPAIALEIGRSILRGLGAIHAVGLIHLDVSSPNILLSVTGEVKIADFGVARGASPRRVQSVSLTFAGTPQYASPDQIRPGVVLDARADQFPVGILLYEMLTGRPLFHAGDPFACLLAIEQVDRRLANDPTFDQLDGIAPGLGAFVRRLLQGDPARRFPTTQDALAMAEGLNLRRPFPGELGDLVRECLGSAPGPVASPAIRTFAAASHVVVQSADIEAMLGGATVSQAAVIVPPTAPAPRAPGRAYALLLLLLAVFMLARVLDERVERSVDTVTVAPEMEDPVEDTPLPPDRVDEPRRLQPRRVGPEPIADSPAPVVEAPAPVDIWTRSVGPRTRRGEPEPAAPRVEATEPAFHVWTDAGAAPPTEFAEAPISATTTPFQPFESME